MIKTTKSNKSAEKKILYSNVDEYHSKFPEQVQEQLQELRNLIKEEWPEVEERISYQMPAFKFKKAMIYYAAYHSHIGFYPGSSPIVYFKNLLTPYKTSKGAIQFKIDEPLPKSLIKKIMKYKLKETQQKSDNL